VITQIRAWDAQEIPNHFARRAVEGEIEIISDLLPALDGATNPPMGALLRIRQAIDDADHIAADREVSELETAIDALRSRRPQ
jgi:hypothetical protein